MKTVDFLETIPACDLNRSRCKQLDELIKVYVSIQGQDHFFNLIQGHLHMKIKKKISETT